MASMILKKRNFKEMLEHGKFAEEQPIVPKRGRDDSGNPVKSFEHYLDRLCIMFPEASRESLACQLASNNNDVISTIENLKFASQANQQSQPKTHFSAEKSQPRNSTQIEMPFSSEALIDQTISKMATCQTFEAAKEIFREFVGKVEEEKKEQQFRQNKKLLAELEIFKDAYKIEKEWLVKETRAKEKQIKVNSELQGKIDGLMKCNFLLLEQIRNLEAKFMGGFGFDSRPIF